MPGPDHWLVWIVNGKVMRVRSPVVAKSTMLFTLSRSSTAMLVDAPCQNRFTPARKFGSWPGPGPPSVTVNTPLLGTVPRSGIAAMGLVNNTSSYKNTCQPARFWSVPDTFTNSTASGVPGSISDITMRGGGVGSATAADNAAGPMKSVTVWLFRSCAVRRMGNGALTACVAAMGPHAKWSSVEAPTPESRNSTCALLQAIVSSSSRADLAPRDRGKNANSH